MSSKRLTWLRTLARRLTRRRSFGWYTPFSRSKSPDKKNVVASLPPEALSPYC